MKSSFALAVLAPYIQAVQLTGDGPSSSANLGHVERGVHPSCEDACPKEHCNVAGDAAKPECHACSKCHADMKALGSGGEFTVTTGKLLDQIATTSSYDLKFDVKPTGIAPGNYASLLLFTSADLQADQNKPPVNAGGRIPGIWFYPDDTKLHVRQGQYGTGRSEWNDGCDDCPALSMLEWSSVHVGVHSNKLTVSVNDVECCSKTFKKQDRAYPKVNVYASHPGAYYYPAEAKLKNVTYDGAVLGNSAVPEIAPVPTTDPITVPTPKASGLTFEESLESKELHDKFLTHQAPYQFENDRLAADRAAKTAAYFADFEAAKAAKSHVEEAKAHEATTSEKAATDSTALEEARKASAAAGQAHKDATADLEAKEQAATAAENMMHASKAAALTAHHEYVAHVAHGSTTGYIH